MSDDGPPVSSGDVVLYKTEDGRTQVEVNLREQTVWLDAHQMATLFQRDRSVVVRHIRNTYRTNEFERKATCARNAQVAKDGRIRQMDIYNLDMIISVGYRAAGHVVLTRKLTWKSRLA